MQGGIVTDGDREGILTILEHTPDQALSDLLTREKLDFSEILKDLDSGAFAGRVVRWFLAHRALQRDLLVGQFSRWFAAENFPTDQRPLAERIIRDIFAVASGLSFNDEGEFKTEIAKRLNISGLMKESQAEKNGFDYPENMTAESLPISLSSPSSGG